MVALKDSFRVFFAGADLAIVPHGLVALRVDVIRVHS